MIMVHNAQLLSDLWARRASTLPCWPATNRQMCNLITG
jgi:hypothetical protein|tara:strand:- start:151 stop:264 length:114 start_codon:yes stop_codon:yes gene_type:complete